MVPPDAERDLPSDPDAAVEALARHPDRQDVRLLAAVLRDGRSVCLIRQRAHDADDAVATGSDLAPGTRGRPAGDLRRLSRQRRGYAGQQAGRFFGSPAEIWSSAALASSKVATLIAWRPSGTAPRTSSQLSAGARK